ncbi:MAG TPA: TfuA-like protein [Stellaceae bacterium]|nr:TfuA-like protein [Stellaceae bacterium]
MSICVFVGPTLPRAEIAGRCDAVCLPPAAQGDIHRAAQTKPQAIGIIDGYFSGAPAVWHKEILWALSQGIPVFGSASMGALRAAELHGFGMRGIGRIFEAFRDGILEDDDEVAIVHGPAELGFPALSEPMVNIRATLVQAVNAGVLSAASGQALEGFAKSVFFPNRSWPALVGAAPACGVAGAELAALTAWLPHGRVDQKREDALAMLAAMQESIARPGPAVAPRFQFEWTHLWDEMVIRSVDLPPAIGSSGGAPGYEVLEELRLEGGDSYELVRARALVRLFAGLHAKRQGMDPTPEALRGTLSGLRARLGLFTRAELDAWLARTHLTAASLEGLIEGCARSEAATELLGAALDRHLLDELRLSGRYESLAARAAQKQTVLGAAANGGAEIPNIAALRLWFFEQRLGRPLPDDVKAFAAERGFSDIADFDGALHREWIYFHSK